MNFAWPMLWQSSLLIVVLLAFEVLFRRKIRASIRYALWLVVLVKLCVPPTLASPTSLAWWLHKFPPPVVAKPETRYTVTYDNGSLPEILQNPLPAFVPPKPAMLPAAWLVVSSIAVSSALLFWLTQQAIAFIPTRKCRLPKTQFRRNKIIELVGNSTVDRYCKKPTQENRTV